MKHRLVIKNALYRLEEAVDKLHVKPDEYEQIMDTVLKYLHCGHLFMDVDTDTKEVVVLTGEQVLEETRRGSIQ